jgi:hypothetical protein
VPRGFDIPLEQREAGEEAHEDLLAEMEACAEYPSCPCFAGCRERALARRAQPQTSTHGDSNG